MDYVFYVVRLRLRRLSLLYDILFNNVIRAGKIFKNKLISSMKFLEKGLQYKGLAR